MKSVNNTLYRGYE